MMMMTLTMTQTQTPDYTNTLNAPIEPGGFRRPCPSPGCRALLQMPMDGIHSNLNQKEYPVDPHS